MYRIETSNPDNPMIRKVFWYRITGAQGTIALTLRPKSIITIFLATKILVAYLILRE
jgi:hypothetical protein